ncbi:MAG: 50S ribosomal protein L4 [Candidatus Aceula meridiana]|nr:50S ribosomal protein L4 [Candidatus Aceula meridiana]
MPVCAIHDIKGKKVEEFDLPESIFGGRINEGVLHQAVLMYQANQRQGTASTKERADVSGGGKKPHRQKGTGRARAGSSRSPLWKGGGVTFGPHPRDFSYSLPKKIKISALKASLNACYLSNDIFCIDALMVDSAKTRDFAKLLKTLKLQGTILAVIDKTDTSTQRASHNIPVLNMVRASDVTAYDILKNKKLLITKDAFKSLLKRLKT